MIRVDHIGPAHAGDYRNALSRGIGDHNPDRLRGGWNPGIVDAAVSAKRQRYSDEFKVRAVKLAMRRDIQIQDVAAALHVHPFMLSRWKREYREGKFAVAAQVPGLPVQTARQQSRVRRLEREVVALKAEVDLLKRAVRLVLGETRQVPHSSLPIAE